MLEGGAVSLFRDTTSHLHSGWKLEVLAAFVFVLAHVLRWGTSIAANFSWNSRRISVINVGKTSLGVAP